MDTKSDIRFVKKNTTLRKEICMLSGVIKIGFN